MISKGLRPILRTAFFNVRAMESFVAPNELKILIDQELQVAIRKASYEKAMRRDIADSIDIFAGNLDGFLDEHPTLSNEKAAVMRTVTKLKNQMIGFFGESGNVGLPGRYRRNLAANPDLDDVGPDRLNGTGNKGLAETTAQKWWDFIRKVL